MGLADVGRSGTRGRANGLWLFYPTKSPANHRHLPDAEALYFRIDFARAVIRPFSTPEVNLAPFCLPGSPHRSTPHVRPRSRRRPLRPRAGNAARQRVHNQIRKGCGGVQSTRQQSQKRVFDTAVPTRERTREEVASSGRKEKPPEGRGFGCYFESFAASASIRLISRRKARRANTC